jgi:hypothetical protein
VSRGRSEAWTRRTTAASAWRPKRIRLLIVAEAPADDERYFYFESGEVDPLFAEVAEVLFEEPASGNREPYLKELRRRGVFVIEAKPDAPRRGEPLAPYIGPLLLNVEMLGAEAIVLISADVYRAAAAAMKKAGLPVIDVRVPSPEHALEFRQKLRQALVRAGLEKLIRPMKGAAARPALEPSKPARKKTRRPNA